jgi:transcriptional/translational regulatory protein YebC/TACO1
MVKRNGRGLGLTPEQRASIEKLLEKFEEDDDVQNVFHNMEEVDDEE